MEATAERMAEIARLRAVLADIAKALDEPDGHATWATPWETMERAHEMADAALRARAGIE